MKITVNDDGIGLKNYETKKFQALKQRVKTMDGNIIFSKSKMSGLEVIINVFLN